MKDEEAREVDPGGMSASERAAYMQGKNEENMRHLKQQKRPR